MFYTHHLRIDDNNMHAVDRNYRVSQMLGFEDVAVEFRLPLIESARSEARSLLRDHDISDGSDLVSVVPGARWETKRWAAERFAEAIDAFSARLNIRTILLGSPDESQLCGQIAAACNTHPVNLAGRTSLAALAGLIELSALVLCHDSAALHLAVALQRPLVCLVGPTNPNRTGPYRRIRDIVRLELDCAPCYFRRLSQCPHEHRCMKELSSTMVVDAVIAAIPNSVVQVV